MKVINIYLFVGTILMSLLAFKQSREINYATPQSTLQTQHSKLSDSLTIDSETGLINDTNLMMIKAQCTACHNTKLIQQHRFTREGWKDKIRWMQKNHKLWDLGESEKVVLDYLEKYYSPKMASQKILNRRELLKNIQWYKLENR
ncbi:hypothetical protein VB776_17950 [Arcicella sp. DC2W]|uniref:Monoheme cytochrome C n=1 Tax=Arcicella gelida TaxID=2984195 RepID=A0ABU5S9C4_9BACT|nr:hypothetical protein [Arcicella sp. DC2W]MEA5404823.1 hypothetical protein [Arcicella sp. DC2W]